MTRDELTDKATQETAEVLEDLHRARLAKNYPAMCDFAQTLKDMAAGLRDLEDE